MTPTEYAAAIRQAIHNLEWLTEGTHTLDNCVRIARERAVRDRVEAAMARPRPTGDTVSNGGLHADPTGDAAVRAQEAETLGGMATSLLAVTATIIDHTALAASLTHQVTRTPYEPCRTLPEATRDLYALADSTWVIEHLNAPWRQAWEDAVTAGIADAAEWLQATANDIHDNPDGHQRPDVDLRLGVVDEIDDADRQSFAGMDPEWVTLGLPDHELLKLGTYEGEFPNWRGFWSAFVPKRTSHVGLYPDRLGQIAKLSKYHHGAIGWTFGGADKPARIDVLSSYPETQGVVMPCRWDLELNAPREDKPDEPSDEPTEEAA